MASLRAQPFAAVLLGLVPTEALTIPALQSWMRDPATLGSLLASPPLEEAPAHRPLAELLGRIVAAGASGYSLVLDG